MERKIYAAYGSNLNHRQMMQRCSDAEFLGTSTLYDYELLFRGGMGSAVATVEPRDGASVPIGLWSVSKRDELALDRYEGYPRLYRKEYITVDFDGHEVEAMIYIINGRPLGSPSLGYAQTIADGYADCGIDTDEFWNRARVACTRQ